MDEASGGLPALSGAETTTAAALDRQQRKRGRSHNAAADAENSDDAAVPAQSGAELAGFAHRAHRVTMELEAAVAAAAGVAAPCGDTALASVPAVARFIVGGDQIDVAMATLRQAPTSLVYRMALAHYTQWSRTNVNSNNTPKVSEHTATGGEEAAGLTGGAARSSTTTTTITTTNSASSAPHRPPPIFIDKDPVIFRRIINLLRGYTTLSADTAPVVYAAAAHTHVASSLMDRFDEFLADCAYFGISHTILEQRFPRVAVPQFSGAGASHCGTRLSCATIVSILDPSPGYICHGTIEARVKVEALDGPRGVLVGVVSARRWLTTLAADCATTSIGCAMLSSSGDVTSSFVPMPVEEAGHGGLGVGGYDQQQFSGHAAAAAAAAARVDGSSTTAEALQQQLVAQGGPLVEDTTGGAFAAGAVVRVVLNMTLRRVTWSVALPSSSAATALSQQQQQSLGGMQPELVVKVLQLPTGERAIGAMALAVVLSKGSQVLLLPPE